MPMSRRAVLTTALAMGGLAGRTALAQAFPSHSIQVVVPVAAGGGTDLLARAVGQRVGELLGQPLVVENRLGAGGNIGVEYVARARADGHTLLVSPATIASNIAVYRKLPYDLLRDFQALTLIGQTGVVLVVHPALKAATVKDWVELARARPDELNYGSAGTGSPQHLQSEYFNQLVGIRTKHIPYKGQSQAMNDLVGGQVQYMFSPLQNALPQIQAGRVRALALASLQRNPALPDLPTLAELGYGPVDLSNWFAVFVPAATPRAVVRKLHAAFAQAGQEAAMRTKLASLGFDAMFTSPEASTDFMRSELVRWARVAAYAGITAE